MRGKAFFDIHDLSVTNMEGALCVWLEEMTHKCFCSVMRERAVRMCNH
jgi:hypothetical protein